MRDRRPRRTFGIGAATSAATSDERWRRPCAPEDRRRWYAAASAGHGQERPHDDDDERPHAHGRQPAAHFGRDGDAGEPVGTSGGGQYGAEGEVRFHAGFLTRGNERADGHDAPSPAPTRR